MRFAGRCKKLKGACGTGHQCARLLNRLAIVQALQLSQLFATPANTSGDSVQHGGPFMGFEMSPVRLHAGFFCGQYRIVHIVGGGSVECCHCAAVMRVFGGVSRA